MTQKQRETAEARAQLAALEAAAPLQDAALEAIEQELLALDARGAELVAGHIQEYTRQHPGRLTVFGAVTLDRADQERLGLGEVAHERQRLQARLTAQRRLIKLRKDLVRQIEAQLAQLEAPAG